MGDSPVGGNSKNIQIKRVLKTSSKPPQTDFRRGQQGLLNAEWDFLCKLEQPWWLQTGQWLPLQRETTL